MKAALLDHYGKYDAAQAAAQAFKVKASAKKPTNAVQDENVQNEAEKVSPAVVFDDLAELEAEFVSPPKRVTRSRSAASSASQTPVALVAATSPIAATADADDNITIPDTASSPIPTSPTVTMTPLSPKTPQNMNDLSLYTRSMLGGNTHTINKSTRGISRCPEEEDEDEEEIGSSQILANISCYSNSSDCDRSALFSASKASSTPAARAHLLSERSPAGTVDASLSDATQSMLTPEANVATASRSRTGCNFAVDTPPTPPMPADMRFSTTTLLNSSLKLANPSASTVGASMNATVCTGNIAAAAASASALEEQCDDDDDEKIIAFSSPIKTSTKILEPRRQLVLASTTAAAVTATAITAADTTDSDSNTSVGTLTLTQVHTAPNPNPVEGWIPLITETEWGLPSTPVFLKMQISYQVLNAAIQRLNMFVAKNLLSNLKDQTYLESFSKDEMNQIVTDVDDMSMTPSVLGEDDKPVVFNMKVIALGLVKLKRLDVSNENGVTVYKVKRFY